MADISPRKVSTKNVVIDTGVTLAAFVVFFLVSRIHVPSNDPTQVVIWSAFTASCLTTVFWLTWQMLKAVFRHQRERSQSEE